ncbi:MAG: hypothetical protein U9N38_03180 [Thermodesulfobacteriota bacterium]|nr:hypothetical protein [Thermodesulfobacteriota bacterium]
MTTKTYRTRRAFLLPILLNSLFLLVLLVISICNRTFPAEPVVLLAVFVPTLCIFLASARRRTSIDNDGVKIRKLFKERTLLWVHITNVDVISLHKKVYLLLTTTKGFHVIANSHEDFTSIVKDLVQHIDQEMVEDGVRDIIDHPVKRISDIIFAWVAFVLLLGAIVLKIIC